MPLYTFECPGCATEFKKIRSNRDAVPCPECDVLAIPRLPQNVSSTAYEMRDPYRGVQLPKNHEGQVKTRMRKHNEGMNAEKIDKFGTDDGQRHGWMKKK